MEGQGVDVVDSWQTYVFQTTDQSLILISLLIVQRGRGRARFCESSFYMSVQGLFIAPVRSAIIQDIERMRAVGLATMAYYYFDFRDVKKQDCYGLLSSLVSQLSAESDSCCNILSQLYSDNMNGTREPDIDSLKECMKDMLNLPGQGPVYIIIDALDECPNSSGTPSAREEVLELIGELVDLDLPNVHLCVASRPEMDIRLVLDPLTTLKISLHDETGQKEDIVKYIKSVVYSDRNMQRWNEDDKQLVVITLSDEADGM
jgi:hypothetical protein